MMRALVFTNRVLRRLLEWTVIAIMSLLVLDVLAGVFIRYFSRVELFQALAEIDLEIGGVTLFAARGTDEMATGLLIWLTMLGAALVFADKGHLGVDYFVGKLDPGAQRLAEAAMYVLILAFSAMVMLYGGAIMVSRTLADGQVLPALGWQKGYVYLAVPIGGVFMILTAAEELLRHMSRTGRGDEAREASPDGQ